MAIDATTQQSRTQLTSALPIVGLAALFLAACEPTVRVEAPREPITINLNIKADVRVRIEEQAAKDIEDNDDIF